jgi:hypothetical protein
VGGGAQRRRWHPTIELGLEGGGGRISADGCRGGRGGGEHSSGWLRGGAEKRRGHRLSHRRAGPEAAACRE